MTFPYAFAPLLLCLAVSQAEATGEVVPLIIYPAAEPVPALRYRLLPEVRDLSPGNAATLYYRACSPEWFSAHRREKDALEKMQAWLKVPLKELPRDEVRRFLPGLALSEVALAARREYCDWELTSRVRKDGIALLLPELSTFREFANLLSLQARLEMAEGKYAAAVRTLETGFALARHVSDGPTLLHGLVGAAILQVLSARLQELSELPDAPNLYWALTTLPRPFIDLRRAMQGERLFLENLFPGLREALTDPKTPPLSAEQSAEWLERLLGGLRMAEGEAAGGGLVERLGIAALVARAHPEARRFLLAGGRTEEQVKAMTALQAVLMFEVANYERIYDDVLKWQGLPYWEARPGLQRVEQRLKEAKAQMEVGTIMATMLIPAFTKVKETQTRAERRLAALRCVEAIRLYAAHDGKLPAALSDIRAVPVPVDPFTGKPFEYEAKDDKAVLAGPPPGGDKPTASNALRYELTLKRK